MKQPSKMQRNQLAPKQQNHRGTRFMLCKAILINQDKLEVEAEASQEEILKLAHRTGNRGSSRESRRGPVQ